MNDSMAKEIVGDLGAGWRRLLATDLVFKGIAVALLTPLAALTTRGLLSLAGSSSVTDEEILFLLLQPLGWLALVGIGAVGLAILALEQAALMGVGFGLAEGRSFGLVPALTLASQRALAVLELAARIVLRALWMAAPFLAALGLVYLWVLGEHDINFYLSNRPPELYLALGLAALLLAGLAGLLVPALLGWVYALPLLVFERLTPAEAMAESRVRTAGWRARTGMWIVGWLVTGALASALVNGLISLLAALVVPRVATSLTLLVPAMVVTVGLFALANLLLTLLFTVLFALLVVRLYRSAGGAERGRLPSEPESVLPAAVSARPLLLWSAFAAFVLGAALLGLFLVQSVRPSDDAQIIAHRGASGVAPENSLAAVERAIEEGADWVEIDVQESADGYVVVAHDSDFMKVLGLSTKVWEASLEELQQIDIGGWFGPEFSGQTVPTLDQVLATCKGRVGVLIELKYYGHDRRLEESVVELVEGHDMASEVAVMSLKLDGARKVKALRPAWRVGLLAAVAVGDLTRANVDFLAVSTRLATAPFIRRAHRQGKEVYVWTVNDAVTLSSQMSRGADGLITDEPALARRVLEQRREMSLAERLLLELALLLGGGSDVVTSEADA